MGIFTSINCTESNPYVISSTTGNFRFSVTRLNRQPVGLVTITYSMNGVSSQVYSGMMSLGDTMSFTISETNLRMMLYNKGSDTLTLQSVCNNETVTQTFTIKIDSTTIRPRFDSLTSRIQSTPLSGIAIRGYSTIRYSYSAHKGYGAGSMILNFSVPYGISGEFTPATYTSNQSSHMGYTDLTVSEGASDLSFFVALEATDSRHQVTDRRNTLVSWKGYTKPQISSTTSIRRCDQNGNYDESGGYVKIVCSATYSLTGYGNTGTIVVKQGANTYHNGDIVVQSQNVARTYTVEATDTVLSSVSGKVTQNITVYPAKFPLDLYDDGRGNLGARVGTIAERGYFTCGLKQKGVFFYGTCSTSGTTARKVCNDVDPVFQLYTGVLVFIKFTAQNGITNPTLNVNGTGAIAIKRYGTTAPKDSFATSWFAGSVVPLIYDGTYWQIVGWFSQSAT